MTSWITICDTCKSDDWSPETDSVPHGTTLAEKVETLAARTHGIKTRRVSCLMGCSNSCNVAIQGADKLSYTLGGFDPIEKDAQAIVDYASLHAESETGQVPFRQWPQGVKGHFVTRHPPLPKDS